MRKITFLSVFLILLSSNCNISNAQTFVEDTTHNLIGTGTGSIEWGDYDNDGDMDAIITGRSNSSGIIGKIYKNINGIFSEQTTILPPGVTYSSVKWGDYDNDGDLDIIYTGVNTLCQNLSIIYKNNGNNTFTHQTTIPLIGISSSSVAWGDYDNDGNLDLLMTGLTSSTTNLAKIYKNNGNNTFTELTSVSLTGVKDASVAWGDYDNDGDLDFVLTGSLYSSGFSRIYKNNGDGTFTEQTNIPLYAASCSSVAWGDYNNDGYIDLLLTGYAVTKIYKNNGDGTFTEQTGISITGVFNSSVSWGDYNNDGYLDILLNGRTYSGNIITKVIKNNGDNTFTEQTNIPIIGLNYGSVNWIDIDNDGDLDISTNGYDANNISVIKIFKNTSSAINQPPSIPTGLHSQQIGNKYLLTWNKSTDNNTPSQTITYAIRVGSTDSTQDIQSSQSDLYNGYHKVLSFGAIQDTFAYIKIPQIACQMGQYIYWSVQSIDNGYRTSSFSAYDSISPNFNILASNDTIIALGDTAKLNVDINNNEPVTYLWSSSDLLDNATIRNPKAFPKNKTTFYVTVTWEDHTLIDSVTISVNQFKETHGSNLINMYDNTSEWGDYDNDGDLDLLLIGRSSSQSNISKIYRNNGNNSFTEQTGILLKNLSCSSADWGDYDNDGDLDLILCGLYNSSNAITVIYKNNGNNTFTEQTGIALTGINCGSVKWGDLDNDGDLDILISGNINNTQNTTKIFKNNGNNTFTEQSGISLSGAIYSSCDWGDSDNDGDLDILLTGSGISKMYKNNGNGSFTEQTGVSLEALDEPYAEWRDWDYDGDLDVFLTGYSNFLFKVKIYNNLGNNIFSEHTNITFPSYFSASSKLGDYDNDGDLDLIFEGFANSTANPVLKAYKNIDNTFTVDTDVKLTQLGNGSLNWGDYDNDGDLDLITTGFNGSNYASKIYQNMTEFRFNNTKPSTPINLTKTDTDSSFLFNWNRSIDDSTNTNSITYNFSIGTLSNPNSIIPSHSLNSGIRLISKMGNMQLDTFALINHNNNVFSFDSMYIAKIQAIDNSFYASPFSSPMTFTMPPIGHILSTGDSVICGESILLSIHISNGDSTHLRYRWIPSVGLSNDTIINPIANPTQTTWYKIIGTSQYGDSFTDSIQITIMPPVYNPNFSAFQTAFTNPPFDVQFTNITPNIGDYDFVWDFGDSTTLNSNNQSINHTYSLNGQYSVSLKAKLKNSSCSDIITKLEYISCSGLSSSNQLNSRIKFNLIPNPNIGDFEIFVDGLTTTKCNVQISTIMGEVVYFETISNIDKVFHKNIYLNSISKGVYFVRLFSDDGVLIKRFVVK